MKKFFRNILIALILIPAIAFFTACDEKPPEEPKLTVIEVDTLEEINNAIKTTDSKHIIKLVGNIVVEEVVSGYIQPVLIFPEEKNYENVTIDLNGYDIQTEVVIAQEIYRDSNGKYVGFRNGTKVTTENIANVNIINSKTTGIIGSQTNTSIDYPITLRINNGCTVNLKNLNTYGNSAGIYSNGNYEGTSVVTAENCNFECVCDSDGAGAYLVSNITTNFDNCEFVGYSAYYTKSGTHNLTNCTFTANGTDYVYPPEHYNSGFSSNASALVIDSAEGYINTLIVNVYGGTFSTVADGAKDIQEFKTKTQSGTIEAYSQVKIYNLSQTDVNYSSDNDTIIFVNAN